MPNTPEYLRLVKQIKSYREIFLPTDLSINPDDRDVVMLRAFVLHCFAEIQSYMEDVCKAIAIKSMRSWLDDGLTSKTTVAMLRYTDCALRQAPKLLHPSKDDKNGNLLLDLSKVVQKHYSNYFAIIEENNGVREGDLIRILLPIGIQSNDISENLKVDLTNLTKRRGGYAHNARHRSMNYSIIDDHRLVIRCTRSIRTLDNSLYLLLNGA